MANATIAVEGLEARAFLLLPPPESAWFSWFFDDRVAIAGGGGTSALSSVDLLADLGVLSATGVALVSLTGQQSAGSLNEPVANGTALLVVSGLEAHTELGEVQAAIGVNAQVSIAGLSLGSQLGQVTAQTVSPETIVGGSWHKRYPTSIEKSAVATIGGLASIIEAGSIRALGAIQVSGVANLQALRVVTELHSTQATGVLGLSDEEILLLLAA